jgi:hypothetical protein
VKLCVVCATFALYNTKITSCYIKPGSICELGSSVAELSMVLAATGTTLGKQPQTSFCVYFEHVLKTLKERSAARGTTSVFSIAGMGRGVFISNRRTRTFLLLWYQQCQAASSAEGVRTTLLIVVPRPSCKAILSFRKATLLRTS